MPDPSDLLAPRAPATAAQTHAEIEAVLRAENIALRDELAALQNRLATGAGGTGDADTLAALKHRHGIELTLAHMRQIVWYAGHQGNLPTLAKMQRALRASEYFDASWYSARVPELQDMGLSPAEHYLRAGSYEGRNPGPGFDTMAYYLANPDVAASSWPALSHFEAFGRAEGRAIKPAQ